MFFFLLCLLTLALCIIIIEWTVNGFYRHSILKKSSNKQAYNGHNSEELYSSFSFSQFVHRLLATMKESSSYPFFIAVLCNFDENRKFVVLSETTKDYPHLLVEAIHISELKPEWNLLCDLLWWNSAINDQLRLIFSPNPKLSVN